MLVYKSFALVLNMRKLF